LPARRAQHINPGGPRHLPNPPARAVLRRNGNPPPLPAFADDVDARGQNASGKIGTGSPTAPGRSCSPQANWQTWRERNEDFPGRQPVGLGPDFTRREAERRPILARLQPASEPSRRSALRSMNRPFGSLRPSGTSGRPEFIEGRSLRAFSLDWPAMSEPGGSRRSDARRVEWRRERDSNPARVRANANKHNRLSSLARIR